MTTADLFDVIIIGGGFSGTMVAANLVHHQKFKQPLRIAIINRRYPFGRGIAYSTTDDYHHLNVMAGKMSAFEAQPDHFVEWLLKLDQFKSLSKDLVAKTFLPRKLYGDYIESIWESTKKCNNLYVLEDEAETFVSVDTLYHVQLRSGKTLSAKAVVLATGNEVPANISVADNAIFQSKRYFRNPWDPRCYKDIDRDQDVLIIGNGLTMVDVVLGLMEHGVKGTIYSLSRNGLQILPHRPTGAVYHDFYKDVKPPYRLHVLFHHFNRHFKKLRTLGLTAEPVIDSIRPLTQKIWHSFTVKEKKIFLKYLRHYWGSARHRLPAHIHDKILHYQVIQKLRVMKGHLLTAREDEKGLTVVIRDQAAKLNREFSVSRIINCTGPESDISKSENVLHRNLFKQGIIDKNPVALGICATPGGNVINSNNSAMPGLYAIGNLMKGVLWECTAVPELRQSAEIIAEDIADYIQCIRKDAVSKLYINPATYDHDQRNQ